MLLYIASDLNWAVRIKSTAEALGVPARPVRSLDMLRERLADSPVRALIADLESPDLALEAIAHLAAINRARSEKRDDRAAHQPPGAPAPDRMANDPPRPIRILAFGPHIHTALLQQARDRGAHDVLPRGAFANNLPDILLRLNAE